MTDIEKRYFTELTARRTWLADALDDPAASGIRKSVVEKYTDQAHFIYELLQNADDVGATSVDFILYPDKLVFKHNGTHHFSISDPSKEETDTKQGILGDINAITSVGNSNKQQASIGKFGVGFKSVFQYTVTPYIYEDSFRFKMERFIVPVELEEDFPGRKSGETVFVFPFNHSERLPEEAYEDIADKLRNLVYPILFLKTLTNISFYIENSCGFYGKRIVETQTMHDVTVNRVLLYKNYDNAIDIDRLWLFSRKDSNNFDYSVGFFTDEDNKLIPVSMPAFCFFPTKEVTNLNFIVHGPFLLTDSREGIKAGEAYNRELINQLAMLAGKSLYCMKLIGEEHGIRYINDTILNIVPINKKDFSDLTDKSKISFLPFFIELREALINGLLPTRNGYTSKDHAYWSDTIEINNLLSDKQLSLLMQNDNSAWVFKSYGRNTTGHNAREGLQEYIDSLTTDYVNEREIYTRMSAEFISAQEEQWLHTFYEWLGNVPRRFDFYKDEPIFLNEEGQPAAAYNEEGERTLFLPSFTVKNCPTVKQSLLDNEKTASFLKNVVKLVEPSLKDYIYNTIIPLYEKDVEIDTDPHFIIFFNYYCECKHEEINEFISKIRPLEFLTYYEQGDDQLYRGKASDLYYPSDELVAYFETKPDARFLDISEYEELLGNDEKKIDALNNFLSDLGLNKGVKVIETPMSSSDAVRLTNSWAYSSGKRSWKDVHPDGCKEILDYTINNQNTDKSLLLWNVLAELAAENDGLKLVIDGIYDYFYRQPKQYHFITPLEIQIKASKWIVDKEGNFVAPGETHIEYLDERYDTLSSGAKKLIEYLDIKSSSDDIQANANLTDKQKQDIALAQKIRDAGLDNEEDIDEILREIKHRREKPRPLIVTRPTDPKPGPIIDPKPTDPKPNPTDDEISGIFDDLWDRTNKRRRDGGKNHSPIADPVKDGEKEVDTDEYHPNVVDYSAQIEKKKEKSLEEIDDILRMQKLQETAVNSEKYSYLWFKTLLDMEILNSGDDSINSREVNISFSRIEHEPGSQRTYILKQPNKYIPQFMEDLADIPLVLHMDDDTLKTVAIEVSSVKSFTLKVKLKNNADLENVDLTKVKEATIKAARPVFLLENLRQGLASLEFEDSDNMKTNLPKDIEFIFGPPGTGKTTYLANNVLIPLMQKNENLKVLVLTPTNKAADVITSRIIESMGDDESYEDWLVRFGITGSEEIEASSVYKDKTFDIRELPKSITVTTIARFPYDFFMPQGERMYLQSLNWDYIVIDEASMIKLVDIIYPIYKKTPQKFIIAGDPFQIEPITSVEMWANENIYTLTNLKSFINPVTEPRQYKVTTLTTQYRSVPEIGNIFSRFTYGGILQHYRDSNSRRDLNLEEIIDIDTLNIIKFPVSKYESIYKAKRLKGTTPYQVYSAIFTMEFVSFLAEELAQCNPEELFRIGVVAPYKAQATLADKLLGSVKLPSGIEVQVGTIHGFQGDECDIVFALLNPPPYISSSDNLFLNKQNILNVAISRARDYLFLVMPDDNTDKIYNLKKVKHIETLIKKSESYTQCTSSSLEKLIFGSETYIEDNSFATSHQIVNVYGQPEMKYEIRSEDVAVDVQIHRQPDMIVDTLIK